MDFDTGNKVIINSMDKKEAVAFIKFLHSDVLRHKKDIAQAYELIIKVGSQFGIPVFEV